MRALLRLRFYVTGHFWFVVRMSFLLKEAAAVKLSRILRFCTLPFLIVAAGNGSAQLVDYPGDPTEHGSVIVALSVSPEGSAETCQIKHSSGVDSLDTGACALMRTAWFEPALDDDGNAVAESIELTIHFIVPHAPPTDADLPINESDLRIMYDPRREAAKKEHGATGPGQSRLLQRLPTKATATYPRSALKSRQEGRVFVTVDVNANGKAQRCSVVRSSGHQALDKETCRYAMKHLRYEPGKDFHGNTIGGVDLFWITWALGSR